MGKGLGLGLMDLIIHFQIVFLNTHFFHLQGYKSDEDSQSFNREILSLSSCVKALRCCLLLFKPLALVNWQFKARYANNKEPLQQMYFKGLFSTVNCLIWHLPCGSGSKQNELILKLMWSLKRQKFPSFYFQINHLHRRWKVSKVVQKCPKSNKE